MRTCVYTCIFVLLAGDRLELQQPLESMVARDLTIYRWYTCMHVG
jgi:hypothetical protein